MSLMHCEACGSLTDDARCDCTKMENGPQKLVPFSLANFRATIAAEIEAERERCALIAENATMGLSPGPLYSAGFTGAKHFIAGRIRGDR